MGTGLELGVVGQTRCLRTDHAKAQGSLADLVRMDATLNLPLVKHT